MHVDTGCTTELTHLGYQFLQTLFEKHDKVSRFSLSLDHRFSHHDDFHPFELLILGPLPQRSIEGSLRGVNG